MHAVIGARPFVVTGVRAVAGAVMPRAAVEMTAREATTTCLVHR
jgi:hypothetical protein